MSRGRPTRPRSSDERMGDVSLLCASNPKGAHAERWRHVHGCGRFFNAVRDTVSDRFVVTYKAGEPRPDGADAIKAADVHEPYRAPRLAAASTARSRCASPSTAAATTGSPGRYAGLGAARQRRAPRRPLVQVSPAARHPRPPARKSRTRSSTSARDAARCTPNLRATQVELLSTACARSARTAGRRCASIVGAVNDALSPLLPAGFYYKTFMWPAGAWTASYEPAIRAAAGLGRAPSVPDPDRYVSRYAHCDVLVVGAGPAGLAAALAAAASGARVILCDEQAEPGGSLLAATRSPRSRAKPAQAWLAEALATLARAPRVTLLPRTTAFGYFAHNMRRPVRARDRSPRRARRRRLPRERLWQVRAKEVVLATGAIERPLVFPGNDRPGIMLAGCGAHLPQPLRRAGRHARGGGRRRTTAPIARRSTCTRPASRSRRSPTCARGVDGAGPEAARGRGHSRAYGHRP